MSPTSYRTAPPRDRHRTEGRSTCRGTSNLTCAPAEIQRTKCIRQRYCITLLIMLLVRTAAAVSLALVLAPRLALAQQQHAEPKIIEVNSSGAGVTSWRRVETRTNSGATSVVTGAMQTPGIEGRWQTQQETTAETIVDASGATSVRQEVYTYGAQRERVLIERTESDQARLPDNTVQSISRTWTADANGRLSLTAQAIEDRGSNAGTSGTNTRLLMRDVNGRLSDTVRTTHTETQIAAGVARQDSSIMRRDVNGRWQPLETRHADNRDDGSAEHVVEETVSQPDMNNVVGISERNVTRRSASNGREDVVIERYVARDPSAVHRSESRMDLSERTRLSTTTAADGTRQTVEEVEGRSPVASGDPMRLRRRIVTTVRPLGGDESIVERQVFDLDTNGRLVLTATERREGAAPTQSDQSTTRAR